MINTIEEMKERGVIVYGAGRIGKQFIMECQNKEIPIVAVWDRNAENMINVEKVQVPMLEYSDKDVPIVICVYSADICNDIERELRSAGFTNIYHRNSQEIVDVHCSGPNSNKRQCNRCVLTYGGCEDYWKRMKGDMNSFIDIQTLSLPITVKCTLSCKECANKCVEYRQKNIEREYDYDSFVKLWLNVESVFGWIKHVSVVGGEVFLHKDWKRICEVVLNSEHVGTVSITTNGIHKFSAEDLKFLKHEKIVILLDDYRSALNETQIKIFESTVEKFEENGVNYVVLDNKYGTWYAYGGFEDRKLTKGDCIKRFRDCIVNQCYLIGCDYCFTICGRMSIAEDFGIVSEWGDKVDMLNVGAPMETRNRIKNLLGKDYLEACKYCNGNTVTVKVAEQVY